MNRIVIGVALGLSVAGLGATAVVAAGQSEQAAAEDAQVAALAAEIQAALAQLPEGASEEDAKAVIARLVSASGLAPARVLAALNKVKASGMRLPTAVALALDSNIATMVAAAQTATGAVAPGGRAAANGRSALRGSSPFASSPVINVSGNDANYVALTF